MLRRLWPLALALLFCGTNAVHAQPPPEPLPAQEPDEAGTSPPSVPPTGDEPSGQSGEPRGQNGEPSAEPSEPEALSEIEVLSARARSIQAFMKGSLSPSIDPFALLSVRLDDAAFTQQESWTDLLSRAEQLRELPSNRRTRALRQRESSRPDAGLAAARFDVRDALLTFFTLEPDTRAALFQTHTARQEAAQAALLAAQPRIDTLSQRATHLQQLMDGELDVEVDPDGLLRVDLTDSAETPYSQARLDALQGRETTLDDARPEQLIAAEASLEQMRVRYLALTREEREQVLEAHRDRQLQAIRETELHAEQVEREANENLAEQAQRARAQALEAARGTADGPRRRVEEARAALHGLQEQLANYTNALSQMEEGADERLAEMEDLIAKVRELEAVAEHDDVEARATSLFAKVRQGLAKGRDGLRDLQGRFARAGREVPHPGPDTTEDDDPGRDEVLTLRSQLAERSSQLADQERDELQRLLSGHSDKVVLLNKARLRLLELVEDHYQSRITGIGSEGIQEVLGEADQIGLEVRSGIFHLPYYGRHFLTELAASPAYFLLLFLKIFALIFFFRWWRQRADGYLAVPEPKAPLQRYAWQTRYHEDEPEADSVLERAWVTLRWYLRRVRKPLEWLLLMWVLTTICSAWSLPGVSYLWILAQWVLGGRASVLLIDAMAERSRRLRRGNDRNDKLRIRSLRIVGRWVVVFGLILALTKEVVGKGVIYEWVISGCWFFAIPVAFWLVYLWRDRIEELLDAQTEPSPFVKVLRDNRTGVKGLATAALGGGYFLARGIWRSSMELASNWSTAQKIRAALFRRQVAKRSENVDEEGRTKVHQGIYRKFDPNAEADPVLPTIAKEMLDTMAEHVGQKRTSLNAVVGERGMGKSTFLTRVAEEAETDVYVISCPEHFGGVIDAIGEALGIAGDATAIKTWLTNSDRPVIALDDTQRLVRPQIGGLEDLDQLTNFARNIGGDVSWIFGIDAASWHYISRARDERVFFDQVMYLPPWSEAQIGNLLKSRSESTSVTPDFDALVVPGLEVSGKDATKQRQEGYHRVLWSASEGNPGLALQYWRESLFKGEGDKPVVGLFRDVPDSEIEGLPEVMLFILRTLVQLEMATVDDVVTATALPAPDVADAIRLSLSRGYIEHYRNRLRITWIWYRTVTNVLRRKHMLVL